MSDRFAKAKKLPLLLLMASVLAASALYLFYSRTVFAWSDLGGGDHGGADWTPANGAVIAGVHTNIGTFTIPAGYTVYVKAVEPATTAGALRRKTYADGVKNVSRSLVENTADSTLAFSGCVAGQCRNFSIRYTGQILTTGTGGTYWFHCYSDDGCRVWVNGSLIINNWTEHTASWSDGAISLSANTWYDIVIDYFQGPGATAFDIDWTPAGGSRGNIPAANMRYYNEPPGLSYGSLEIQARAINIAGTLNASGAGYGGGGGGGGGGCTWTGGSSGAAWAPTAGGVGGGGGSANHPQYGNAGAGGSGGSGGGSAGGGVYGGGGGGGGAGPYAGSGGAGGSETSGDLGTCTNTPGGSGSSGQAGGYAAVGGQGDSTTDESINIGSGGGGGGGGAPGGICSVSPKSGCICSVSAYPGGGGGAGGAGGGAVKLIAYSGTGSLTVSGSIVTTGVYAGNGLSGSCLSPSQNNAAGGIAVPNAGSSAGGAGEAGTPAGGSGGAGGGGAGGGVLLKGKVVSITGVNALGAGSATFNGGTIKIFYESGSWSGLSYGRLFTRQLPPSDAPTGMTGSAPSETVIRWSWTDNSPAEASYTMYDADTGAELYTFAANTTSYDEGGRTPGVTYRRYVKACNAAGCSAASNTASASTGLAVPSGFSGTQLSETSIRWSWTDNSGAESGYRVLRVSDNATMSVDLPSNTVSWDEMNGITPGNSYGRYAQAFVAGGGTANSNTATVTPILYAPSGLIGASVPGNPNALDWTFNDNSAQETEYRLYSYTNSTCTAGEALAMSTTSGTGSGTGSRTIRETGLSGSTTYWRQVAVYRSPPGVLSAKSNCAEGRTGATYTSQAILESAVYDTQKVGGVAFNYIMWRGALAPNTSVNLQVASSPNASGPWTYVGPGCSTTSYYTDQPHIQQRIDPKCHTGHRYFRYKIYLNSPGGEATPIVEDVILGWSP